jgi:hypothetical protein
MSSTRPGPESRLLIFFIGNILWCSPCCPVRRYPWPKDRSLGRGWYCLQLWCHLANRIYEAALVHRRSFLRRSRCRSRFGNDPNVPVRDCAQVDPWCDCRLLPACYHHRSVIGGYCQQRHSRPQRLWIVPHSNCHSIFVVAHPHHRVSHF